MRHLRELPRRMLAAIRGFGFKQWFLLVLNVVLVLASIGCAVGMNMVGGALTSLTAAERFRGGAESRFAHVACYLPVDDGKSEEDILSFRRSLEGRMMEQSLEAAEGGRLYLDAYHGIQPVSISAEGGSASVKAVGVGGDFFYFHPLTLRSGAYIDSEDLMDDLVILDEEIAWRLYGGTNLAGMPVTINGEHFLIGGVVARETDFATERAYPGDGGVYMSFSAMKRLNEDAAVTGYEIVMPDPITSYAKGVVSDTFPIGAGDVVENSRRYSLSHLWEVLRSFGERSMRSNGVIYPYWENAARLTEDYAALLLLLSALFAVCPVVFILVLSIRDIRRAYRFAKVKIPEKVDAAVEKRKEERLEKAYQKKAGGEQHGRIEPAQRKKDI